MPETKLSAIAIETEPQRGTAPWATAGAVLSHVAEWAGETAQKFGALLSALMGPAVFSAYAFALWSLAANLGWTNTFVFTAGPLSNWLVWFGIAVLTNVAASVLLRQYHSED